MEKLAKLDDLPHRQRPLAGKELRHARSAAHHRRQIDTCEPALFEHESNNLLRAGTVGTVLVFSFVCFDENREKPETVIRLRAARGVGVEQLIDLGDRRLVLLPGSQHVRLGKIEPRCHPPRQCLRTCCGTNAARYRPARYSSPAFVSRSYSLCVTICRT